MISREIIGREEEPSKLEAICMEARNCLEEEEICTYELKVGDDEDCQFQIDCEKLESTSNVRTKLDFLPPTFGSKGRNGQNPLSKLEASMEEEEADNEGSKLNLATDEDGNCTLEQAPTISKISTLLMKISAGDKSWRHESEMQKSGCFGGTSSGNRSVNEQLPASTICEAG